MSYHDLTPYQKRVFNKDLRTLNEHLNCWGFEIVNL